MEGLHLYSRKDIEQLTTSRDGENKLGERVQLAQDLTRLSASSAKFVLLGIPEDIGVRANRGIAGTKTAWPSALRAILNVQSNRFLNGSELLVLGHVEIQEPENSDITVLKKKVEEIDELVFPLIQCIVEAGKIPIVIGGGHNNAYPIIKGCAIAQQQAIHVINIDAHADLRAMDGRHSGNGFSYALRDGYLSKYGIFGLHQSYNNEAMLQQIAQDTSISAIFFEEMLVNPNFKIQFWKELSDNFEIPGLEIDLDSVQDILASATTPSGLELNLLRELILSSTQKYAYLHICEGATEMADGRSAPQTAKAIAYLICDFIKNQK